MPVRKVRSLQEAEDASRLDRHDPRLWANIVAVWRRSALLFPRRFPRGVYKHRSIDELNRNTDAWEVRAARAARAERQQTPD